MGSVRLSPSFSTSSSSSSSSTLSKDTISKSNTRHESSTASCRPSASFSFIPSLSSSVLSSSSRPSWSRKSSCRPSSGVHGRERHLRGGLRSPRLPFSDGEAQESWGGGRVKVREMTDLLGVSNSLMRPPLRSWRRENGLTRAGVPKHGEVAGGNTSDWLRDIRWSPGWHGELLLLYGLTSTAMGSEETTTRIGCQRTGKTAKLFLGECKKSDFKDG